MTFTIGKKIAAGFAAVVLVTCALGGLAVSKLIQLRAGGDQIAKYSLPATEKSGELVSLAKDCRTLTYRFLVASTPAEMDDVEGRLKTLKGSIDQCAEEYSKTMTTDEQRRTFAEVPVALQNFRTIRAETLTLHRARKNDEAKEQMFSKAMPAFDILLSKLEAVKTENRTDGQAVTNSIANIANTSVTLVWCGIGTAVLLASVISAYIVVGVKRALGTIAGTLNANAGQVSSAAGQVSVSSQALAKGATEQAGSLEETSSAIEEMSAMTRKNADSADQANILSTEAKAAADEGNAAMAKMSAAINGIQKSSVDTAKIIKVIDEIAFQTNLLALNAAVEAARRARPARALPWSPRKCETWRSVRPRRRRTRRR